MGSSKAGGKAAAGDDHPPGSRGASEGATSPLGAQTRPSGGAADPSAPGRGSLRTGFKNEAGPEWRALTAQHRAIVGEPCARCGALAVELALEAGGYACRECGWTPKGAKDV